MELGEKLRQARLEAGLSQRQLCGEEITRNMLSQIENGSARPSMDTLRYLATRLGKSVSYFLEEQAVVSPNQAVMGQLRTLFANCDWAQLRKALETYRAPDPVFDGEYWLIAMLTGMALAEQAQAEGKAAYALTLLQQAEQAAERTPYDTPALKRQRLLLTYRADPASARTLAEQLPEGTEKLLLRGQAALDGGDPMRCGVILDAAVFREDARWRFLRAEAYLALDSYADAIEHYRAAEGAYPRRAAEKLEQCYRELEDYQQAYHYACKLRQL